MREAGRASNPTPHHDRIAESRPGVGAFVALSLIAMVTAAAGAQPIAGSPGRIDGRSARTDACPTFIWSAVANVARYELAVYRIDSELAPDRWRRVVSQSVPAGITAWAPDLARCLERGASYAWLVGAISASGSVEWSRARRFSVPPAPSPREVERALAVLEAARGEPDNGRTGAADAPRDEAGDRASSPRRRPRRADPEDRRAASPGGVADRVGLRASVDSAQVGVGVLGSSAAGQTGSAGVVAQSTATTGEGAGLRASAASSSGSAAVLSSEGGADLLRGTVGGAPLVSIDAAGLVSAPSFAGDGSALTDVPPAAHTHDGADVTTGEIDESFVDPDIARDAEILPAVLAGDGEGSGLDADLLDGFSAENLTKLTTFLAHATSAANPHQVTATQTTPATQKGDLEVFDGSAVVRLPAGADGLLLRADSSAPSGLGWVDRPELPAGSSCTPGTTVSGFAPDGTLVCEQLTVNRRRQIAAPGGGAYEPALAVGGDGYPIALYSSYVDLDVHLEVVHCEDFGCLATTRTTVETQAVLSGSEYPKSLAVGADGLPVFAYWRLLNDSVVLGRCSEATCASFTLEPVESGIDEPDAVAVGIGGDDLPVVAYTDGSPDADLRVAHCDDASCTSSTVTTVDAADDVGWGTSIAIAPDGYPSVAYANRSSGTIRYARCGNATCTSSTTKTLTVYGGTHDVRTGLAFDATGRAHVTYTEDDATVPRVHLLICADTACTTTAADRDLTRGVTLQTVAPVAVGAGDLAVVAVRADRVGADPGYELLRCSDATCSSFSTAVLTTEQTGFPNSPAIALDSASRPIVAYDKDPGSDLELTFCATADCL